MCPYVANPITTLDGAEAWEAVEACMNQLRVLPGGYLIGLDLGAVFTVAQAKGYCMQTMVELIPEIEAGMIIGARKLRETGNDD